MELRVIKRCLTGRPRLLIYRALSADKWRPIFSLCLRINMFPCTFPVPARRTYRFLVCPYSLFVSRDWQTRDKNNGQTKRFFKLNKKTIPTRLEWKGSRNLLISPVNVWGGDSDGERNKELDRCDLVKEIKKRQLQCTGRS